MWTPWSAFQAIWKVGVKVGDKVANFIKGLLYETLCIITFMKHEEKKHFIYSTEHLFHCLFIEPI